MVASPQEDDGPVDLPAVFQGLKCDLVCAQVLKDLQAGLVMVFVSIQNCLVVKQAGIFWALEALLLKQVAQRHEVDALLLVVTDIIPLQHLEKQQIFDSNNLEREALQQLLSLWNHIRARLCYRLHLHPQRHQTTIHVRLLGHRVRFRLLGHLFEPERGRHLLLDAPSEVSVLGLEDAAQSLLDVLTRRVVDLSLSRAAFQDLVALGRFQRFQPVR